MSQSVDAQWIEAEEEMIDLSDGVDEIDVDFVNATNELLEYLRNFAREIGLQ